MLYLDDNTIFTRRGSLARVIQHIFLVLSVLWWIQAAWLNFAHFLLLPHWCEKGPKVPNLSLSTFVLCKLRLPSWSFGNMVSSALFLFFIWYVSYIQSLTTQANSFPTFRVLSVVALLVAEKYIPIMMHSLRDKSFTNSCILSWSASYTILMIILIIKYMFISFSTKYVVPVYALLFIIMMQVGDLSIFWLEYAMKVMGGTKYDNVFHYLPSKHTFMKYFD